MRVSSVKKTARSSASLMPSSPFAPFAFAVVLAPQGQRQLQRAEDDLLGRARAGRYAFRSIGEPQRRFGKCFAVSEGELGFCCFDLRAPEPQLGLVFLCEGDQIGERDGRLGVPR